MEDTQKTIKYSNSSGRAHQLMSQQLFRDFNTVSFALAPRRTDQVPVPTTANILFVCLFVYFCFILLMVM